VSCIASDLAATFIAQPPTLLGGGFKHVLFFAPTWGDDPI